MRKKLLKALSKNKTLLTILSSFVVLVLLAIVSFHFYYKDRIYSNIFVGKVYIGNLTEHEAINALNREVSIPEKVTLVFENRFFEISLSDLSFAYDMQTSVKKSQGLQKGIVENLLGAFKSYSNIQSLPLSYTVDDKLLSVHLSVIADEVTTQPVYPSARVVNNSIEIDSGKAGTDIDIDRLQEVILHNLSNANFNDVELPVFPIDPTLSEVRANKYMERAGAILGKSVVVVYEDKSEVFKEGDLIKMLDFNNGYSNDNINKNIEYLVEKISRKPQNPIFESKNGRVQEFAPALNGLEVDANKLFQDFVNSLIKLESDNITEVEIALAINLTPPDIATGEVNDLGIKELLGKGESKFHGSIASRIYNIGLSSSRFNGVLIAPGEIVSFNEIVGDISALTGYKQAYIIQNGSTVLGDGGGVCQVSTTFFRAMLDVGLPIVDRRAHSYRVKYYEQDSLPGIDATIYVPNVDLKAKNDTPGYILIQTTFDAEAQTLAFEIYGTSDGRVSEISKPIISGQAPPPEPLYQDDPTLPMGQVKQIDWAAWGAKVRFDYKVTRDGEILQDETFYSNYRPWQAKFLRGTGPAT